MKYIRFNLILIRYYRERSVILFLSVVITIVFFSCDTVHTPESLKGPSLEWENLFSDVDPFYFSSIILTTANDYIVGGMKIINGMDGILLMRIDRNGAILWAKTIATFGSDQVAALIRTRDNQYVAFGNKNDQSWICEFDIEGNIIWDRSIDSEFHGEWKSIACTADGGFISICSKLNDSYLVKLSAEGELLWKVLIGKCSQNHWQKIATVSDNSSIVSFTTYPAYLSTQIMRFDQNGVVLWSNTIKTGSSTTILGDLTITKKNEIVICGSTGDANLSAWIAKLALNGQQQWMKIIESGVKNIYAGGVTENDEGDLVVIGQGDFPWIKKLTQNGDSIWEYRIPEHSLHFFPTDIIQIYKDEYIICGGKSGNSGGEFSGWIFELIESRCRRSVIKR